MKIEVGHKVFYNNGHLGPRSTLFAGTVYKINTFFLLPERNEGKAFTIYIKEKKSKSFLILTRGKLDYNENIKFMGIVTPEDLEIIQEEMVCMEKPVCVKKSKISRGPITIRPDALLNPNTNYRGKNLKIFVKTKKQWFTLLNTTAKMAIFDGGRCAINSISKVRDIK
ncbi:MAG: hypothetical protein M0P14_00770 [Alkaliphilus sp.]|nr:hypothetical protein [Alkaliphilus sp.]